jgi:hypothetical protein
MAYASHSTNYRAVCCKCPHMIHVVGTGLASLHDLCRETTKTGGYTRQKIVDGCDKQWVRCEQLQHRRRIPRYPGQHRAFEEFGMRQRAWQGSRHIPVQFIRTKKLIDEERGT